MHIPVLTKEIIEYLNPQPNQNFIDCTIDGGGHSFEILKRTAPKGKILGIDLDKTIIDKLDDRIKKENLASRFILFNGNYSNLRDIISQEKFNDVSGILLDLGMSTEQIETSGRGFSFLRDEPLDMRFSVEDDFLTAEEIINKWPQKELERIFKEYGEERFFSRIAGAIIYKRKEGKINSTFQLVEIIKRALPPKYKYGRIHFATRVFQALRIAVNDELGNIERVLPQTLEIVKSGGRVAVISFHSLEDRIVKIFIREQVKLDTVKSLTKKPLIAQEEETNFNPKARSAKLRVFEIL